MLPEASQARKAIWEAVNPHSGIRRIDEAFPLALRESTRENEMFIRFKSSGGGKAGSTWQVVGSDNYNSLVGSPPIGIVFSEWALADPTSWAYLRPILRENGGWALFIYTPRGRNHGATSFEAARDNPDWFCQKLTAEESGVFSKDDLAKELAEYKREFGVDDGESRFRQEYMCDFNVAVVGAYWGREMTAAEDNNRIGRIAHDQAVRVDTWWDLGHSDATAIWFVQHVHNEIHVIDYWEANGSQPSDWANILEVKRKERKFTYGRHIFPHDGGAKTAAGGGKSLADLMFALGISVEVQPKYDVQVSIVKARQMLSRCWFDREHTMTGIEALRAYTKRWSDETRTFSVAPLHNWASHGCFDGATKILTRSGTHQIKDLPPSGEVLTPCGWKQYINPRITLKSAPLVEVAFKGGFTVKCTPDHLFLTESGWKSAESLMRGTVIQSSLIQSRSILMAVCTAFGVLTDTLRVAVRRFTGLLGGLHSAQFQMAVTSTTRMGTPSITHCQTLSVFPQQSTYREPGKRRGIKDLLGLTRRPETPPLNGMDRKPEDCGIGDMPRDQKVGKSGSGKIGRVSCAGKLFRHLREKADTLKSIAVGNANTLIIESVSNLENLADVWDITVPDGHCFSLENGAVVHNSDAFRTGAMAVEGPMSSRMRSGDRYARSWGRRSSSPWAA
jgi:hypothetical protein